MTIVPVLLPLKLYEPFNYENRGDPLSVGTLITVPFRRKQAQGVVWSNDAEEFKGELKVISSKLDLPPLPSRMLEFIEKVANYTLSPIGLVLKMVLNKEAMDNDVKSPRPFEIPQAVFHEHEITLSDSQQIATEAINNSIGKFQPFLLDGITGSGKTEVYFATLANAVTKGYQVLVLLPEIALTSQWLTRFEKVFGTKPLVWHSAITSRARRETWKAILDGRAQVIVGARSALFLPFAHLGLIIVDEEHDGSYKQEEQVIYHARDMAVLRGKIEDCPVVLASATPSVETMVNAKNGRYKLLSLKERFGGAQLPQVSIIDMRKSDDFWISATLLSEIKATIARSEQALVFLNRRGYAPLTLCHSCGHRMTCSQCSAWLFEHKSQKILKCHHCDCQQPVPDICPECRKCGTLIPCGPGVERIEEILSKKLPSARMVQLTSDTLSSPKHAHEAVERITKGEVDIIVATQIFAKGYHFEKLTLVGVIDGDLGLTGADLRACEKTYQLLHQVAGRAGRESLPGKVIVQTHNPTHPVLLAMIEHDRDAFLDNEILTRAQVNLPPFGQLAAIIVSGRDSYATETFIKQLAERAPRYDNIMVMGPIHAPLAQLKGKHRFRLLVKAHQRGYMQNFIREWLDKVQIPSNINISIDIDPYSFY